MTECLDFPKIFVNFDTFFNSKIFTIVAFFILILFAVSNVIESPFTTKSFKILLPNLRSAMKTPNKSFKTNSETRSVSPPGAPDIPMILSFQPVMMVHRILTVFHIFSCGPITINCHPILMVSSWRSTSQRRRKSAVCLVPLIGNRSLKFYRNPVKIGKCSTLHFI